METLNKGSDGPTTVRSTSQDLTGPLSLLSLHSSPDDEASCASRMLDFVRDTDPLMAAYFTSGKGAACREPILQDGGILACLEEMARAEEPVVFTSWGTQVVMRPKKNWYTSNIFIGFDVPGKLFSGKDIYMDEGRFTFGCFAARELVRNNTRHWNEQKARLLAMWLKIDSVGADDDTTMHRILVRLFNCLWEFGTLPEVALFEKFLGHNPDLAYGTEKWVESILSGVSHVLDWDVVVGKPMDDKASGTDAARFNSLVRAGDYEFMANYLKSLGIDSHRATALALNNARARISPPSDLSRFSHITLAYDVSERPNSMLCRLREREDPVTLELSAILCQQRSSLDNEPDHAARIEASPLRDFVARMDAKYPFASFKLERSATHYIEAYLKVDQQKILMFFKPTLRREELARDARTVLGLVGRYRFRLNQKTMLDQCFSVDRGDVLEILGLIVGGGQDVREPKNSVGYDTRTIYKEITTVNAATSVSYQLLSMLTEDPSVYTFKLVGCFATTSPQRPIILLVSTDAAAPAMITWTAALNANFTAGVSPPFVTSTKTKMVVTQVVDNTSIFFTSAYDTFSLSLIPDSSCPYLYMVIYNQGTGSGNTSAWQCTLSISRNPTTTLGVITTRPANLEPTWVSREVTDGASGPEYLAPNTRCLCENNRVRGYGVVTCLTCARRSCSMCGSTYRVPDAAAVKLAECCQSGVEVAYCVVVGSVVKVHDDGGWIRDIGIDNSDVWHPAPVEVHPNYYDVLASSCLCDAERDIVDVLRLLDSNGGARAEGSSRPASSVDQGSNRAAKERNGDKPATKESRATGSVKDKDKQKPVDVAKRYAAVAARLKARKFKEALRVAPEWTSADAEILRPKYLDACTPRDAALAQNFVPVYAALGYYLRWIDEKCLRRALLVRAMRLKRGAKEGLGDDPSRYSALEAACIEGYEMSGGSIADLINNNYQPMKAEADAWDEYMAALIGNGSMGYDVAPNAKEISQSLAALPAAAVDAAGDVAVKAAEVAARAYPGNQFVGPNFPGKEGMNQTPNNELQAAAKKHDQAYERGDPQRPADLELGMTAAKEFVKSGSPLALGTALAMGAKVITGYEHTPREGTVPEKMPDAGPKDKAHAQIEQDVKPPTSMEKSTDLSVTAGGEPLTAHRPSVPSTVLQEQLSPGGPPPEQVTPVPLSQPPAEELTSPGEVLKEKVVSPPTLAEPPALEPIPSTVLASAVLPDAPVEVPKVPAGPRRGRRTGGSWFILLIMCFFFLGAIIPANAQGWSHDIATTRRDVKNPGPGDPKILESGFMNKNMVDVARRLMLMPYVKGKSNKGTSFVQIQDLLDEFSYAMAGQNANLMGLLNQMFFQAQTVTAAAALGGVIKLGMPNVFLLPRQTWDATPALQTSARGTYPIAFSNFFADGRPPVDTGIRSKLLTEASSTLLQPNIKSGLSIGGFSQVDAYQLLNVPSVYGLRMENPVCKMILLMLEKSMGTNAAFDPLTSNQFDNAIYQQAAAPVINYNNSPVAGDSLQRNGQSINTLLPYSGADPIVRFFQNYYNMSEAMKAKAIFVPESLLVYNAGKNLALLALCVMPWPMRLTTVTLSTVCGVAAAANTLYIPFTSQVVLPGQTEINFVLPITYTDVTPGNAATAAARVKYVPQAVTGWVQAGMSGLNALTPAVAAGDNLIISWGHTSELNDPAPAPDASYATYSLTAWVNDILPTIGFDDITTFLGLVSRFVDISKEWRYCFELVSDLACRFPLMKAMPDNPQLLVRDNVVMFTHKTADGEVVTQQTNATTVLAVPPAERLIPATDWACWNGAATQSWKFDGVMSAFVIPEYFSSKLRLPVVQVQSLLIGLATHLHYSMPGISADTYADARLANPQTSPFWVRAMQQAEWANGADMGRPAPLGAVRDAIYNTLFKADPASMWGVGGSCWAWKTNTRAAIRGVNKWDTAAQPVNLDVVCPVMCADVWLDFATNSTLASSALPPGAIGNTDDLRGFTEAGSEKLEPMRLTAALATSYVKAAHRTTAIQSNVPDGWSDQELWNIKMSRNSNQTGNFILSDATQLAAGFLDAPGGHNIQVVGPYAVGFPAGWEFVSLRTSTHMWIPFSDINGMRWHYSFAIGNMPTVVQHTTGRVKPQVPGFAGGYNFGRNGLVFVENNGFDTMAALFGLGFGSVAPDGINPGSQQTTTK